MQTPLHGTHFPFKEHSSSVMQPEIDSVRHIALNQKSMGNIPTRLRTTRIPVYGSKFFWLVAKMAGLELRKVVAKMAA
jgi:hypothetical protein